MFDLKDLPPAIVEHQLLLVGLAVAWLVLGYFNGESRKLTHIPSTESVLPPFSYLGALNYLWDARKVMNAGAKKWPKGIFKIPDILQWLVIVTESRFIEEIRKAPDGELSLMASLDELLQLEYTLGAHITKNPYHIPIIRAQLTRAIPKLLPEVHEEIVDAFNEYIPPTSDWTSVPASETFMKIICRTSNRIFVGRPLCRDPDFVALNVQFTIDIFTIGTILHIVPSFIRPFVNKLISNIPKKTQRGLNHLAPLIAARRKQREASSNTDERPLDFLTWLMDEAKGEEATDWYLTTRIMNINVSAIHTSSMTFTHAFYYLAAFPEYMQPLREEVEEVIQREGWTKEALDMMPKLDSFIKESQRLHPISILGMPRKVLNGYTFTDGTKVPRGSTVAVALESVHLNDTIYPDALTFDPLRFVKLKEQDATARKFDIVNTSMESLAFGHGRHACPGRFFAASSLKMTFAHVVMNYDVKLENEGVRPKDLWLVTACTPNRNAKVSFRKRVL